MLPTVDFCGLNPTRLLIGANPFGGFSHQSPERDNEMRAFNSKEEIIETWHRAEAAGINTMVTNNETPRVLEPLKEYISKGGKLQWIAQVNSNVNSDMISAIDEVVEIGCKALYFHGGMMDGVRGDGGREEEVCKWAEHARQAGVVVGSAAHDPDTHRWLDGLGILDFHTVCFFNCGSVHDGAGEKFRLSDVAKAVEFIQSVNKPCIAYKIMGAGRLDPLMAFEYAFESIKATDIVNVGMNRGDNDNMVADNVAMVERILG